MKGTEVPTVMSSALFGILQLDRGEPLGFAHVGGLIQSWLVDAGGFAMVGLVFYLVYALATPREKSQSEKLRVPVSTFMVGCAGVALVCYAAVGGLYALQASGRTAFMGQPISAPEPPPPPPGMPIIVPPPSFETELAPLLLMVAGTFAILGIGQPFARDMRKIFHRNLSLSLTGVRRLSASVGNTLGGLLTTRRVIALGIALAVYAAVGVAVSAFGSDRLFGVYLGVCVVGVTVFVLGLLSLMLFEAEGPVWAIAKLSFKEALRSQFLWLFLLIFLPFLFPAQWFRTIRPGDELRVTVERMDLALTLLVLIPAVLLASFYGIPNDVKNLNIYTVVSKPVERFEIVLGRFIGYVSLMTLVLIGLTGVGLVLILNTSISDKARAETYKARVPVRGKLEFRSMQKEFRPDKQEFTGTNVGREFDYRRYIGGSPESPQRAVWNFTTVPAALASAANDRVPVEFTFDIFKLTKGEQNKGAVVSFRFVTHHARQEQPTQVTGEWPWADRQAQKEYEEAVRRLDSGTLVDRELADRLKAGAASDEQAAQLKLAQRLQKLADELKAKGVTVATDDRGVVTVSGVNVKAARPGTPSWAAANVLAEEFGIFVYGGKEVFDYQVMGVEVPAGLFRNALEGDPGKMKDPDGKEVPFPRFSVYVKCETPGQLLGMAEPDLYLLEYEQPFALNYVKGMVGLWCGLAILVGIAVACSTYLSGVLSLLAASLIFITGFFTDHLRDVATNRTVGGGPLESLSKLIKTEQPTAPTAETAGAAARGRADKFIAWGFRRVEKLFPDQDAYDWSQFVSEGFNISSQYLAVNLLVTFGYLLPWGIGAYYLMKLREVAA
jgi:hypothetical protein